jgi:hypothetical protein
MHWLFAESGYSIDRMEGIHGTRAILGQRCSTNAPAGTMADLE